MMSGPLWEAVKAAHPVGDVVTGEVASVQTYGVWVELGHRFAGLIQAPDAGIEGGRRLDDVYRVGEPLSAVVVGYSEPSQQLVLSRTHRKGG